MAAPASAAIWISIGPSGGAIRALAVAPSDPYTVYVGTDGGMFTLKD